MQNRPLVVLVAAVGRNGVIGRDGQLAWREPEDQRYFRKVTMGNPVLMGRKTWDSLPARFRPLPGRRNLVLTRDPAWRSDGAEAVNSIDRALDAVAGAERLSVIGGAEVYALALPHADELLLTEVDADLEGDTFFPGWHRAAYGLVSHDDRAGYRFATYRRRVT